MSLDQYTRIPDLSHFVQPVPAQRWHAQSILRCVERGWRRDQAALRRAVREDPAVCAQVERLMSTFAYHPWQPDVYEFWYNYARYFRARRERRGGRTPA